MNHEQVKSKLLDLLQNRSWFILHGSLNSFFLSRCADFSMWQYRTPISRRKPPTLARIQASANRQAGFPINHFLLRALNVSSDP